MSQDEVDVQAPANGSHPEALHSRMRAHAEQLEKKTTEIFPIPGYAALAHVELMPLGWETMQKLRDRVASIRDPSLTDGLRQLYVAADILVAATVQFYEADADGNRHEVDQTWLSLAQGVVKNFPEDGSPRMAVLALIGQPTSRLIFFYEEWLGWANGERSTVNEELGRDFARTR